MILYRKCTSVFWLQFNCVHQTLMYLRYAKLVFTSLSASNINRVSNIFICGVIPSKLVMSMLALRCFKVTSSYLFIIHVVKPGHEFG